MTDSNRGNVLVVFGEQNVQVRRTVADSLRHNGFRNTQDTDKFDDVRSAIEQDQVDVLICDADLGGRDACDLVRRVRNHEIGSNPFLVTIVLTDDSTPSTIRRLIDSGTDDIVMKPVSVGGLMKRIDALTRSRKGFVVTTDYVGPDRRKGPRPGTQEIPVFKVPNALRFKAEGGIDMAAFQRSVDAARCTVNEQKMERHAFQIDYLADRIVPYYEAGNRDTSPPKLVTRLLDVAKDLVRRMAGTEREHICELGSSLIDVATSISHSPMAPNMKDVRLLPEMGAAIKRAFSADERNVAFAHDISMSLENRTF